jgi:hypothetical protein
MRKKPYTWRNYASMVVAARAAMGRRELRLKLMPGENQRLPGVVRRVIRACQSETPRPRLEKGEPVLRMYPPVYVNGFQDVMATIAAIAGCSVKTLYRWTAEFEREMSQLTAASAVK